MTNEDFKLLCLLEDLDSAVWAWSSRENDGVLERLSWEMNDILVQYEILLNEGYCAPPMQKTKRGLS